MLLVKIQTSSLPRPTTPFPSIFIYRQTGTLCTVPLHYSLTQIQHSIFSHIVKTHVQPFPFFVCLSQECVIPVEENAQNHCKKKQQQQQQHLIMEMPMGSGPSSNSRRKALMPLPNPTTHGIENYNTAGQHQKQQGHGAEEVKLAALAIAFNIRLRSADMPFDMQERALRHTRALLDSTDHLRQNPTLLARSLKKEFDWVYGPAWHCVAGKSFGSFVTHSPGGFLYFSVDSLSLLLFKTEVHVITKPPPRP